MRPSLRKRDLEACSPCLRVRASTDRNICKENLSVWADKKNVTILYPAHTIPTRIALFSVTFIKKGV